MLGLFACLFVGIVVGLLPLPWWVQYPVYLVMAVICVAAADMRKTKP